MPNYEDILQDTQAVASATAGGIRDIKWLTGAEIIGVARDMEGRLEVFLKGLKLNPSSRTVHDALEYHTWHRKLGAPFAANRLMLPALGHFDPVAAFICTELLRNGADQDVEQAFRVTEPIIELAIERLLLSESSLLGLVGELLLLNSMCALAAPHQVGSVILSWDGWRRSVRDFHWDGTGVEVKTTMRSTSTHMVQGIHQIELFEGENGEQAEDRLLLVSVGLQRTETGPNTISVPALVQRIVDRLEATGSASQVPEFLTRLSRYGSESGVGYDHALMQHDAPFTSTFTVAFFRGYDVMDPSVEVLRRDDVAARHHVELQTVMFRITLPASISATNPIVGANQVARSILRV